jgi:hypothetical protein
VEVALTRVALAAALVRARARVRALARKVGFLKVVQAACLTVPPRKIPSSQTPTFQVPLTPAVIVPAQMLVMMARGAFIKP